jgi:hypothetical protein
MSESNRIRAKEEGLGDRTVDFAASRRIYFRRLLQKGRLETA